MINLITKKPNAFIFQTATGKTTKENEPLHGTVKDSSEISNTSKAFARIDDFLNLGKSDRLNIDDLNEGEKKEFLKMLSELIKKGIVGYEVIEVNGKPEKHYIVNEIGDERLKGTKLYKKNYYK
ncbi:MAG: hypothetical protein Q8903_03235 [Bacteroidota bacterium]|nr:hypothetical protein [Bacteroidota bacterium]